MQKDILLYVVLDVLFSGVFFNRIGNIQKLFSRFWFSLRSQLRLTQDERSINRQPGLEEKRDDNKIIISREEVEIVMESLGIFCSPESEKLKESMGVDEILELFDEKEPSLDEVKEAFDVFDVNRDGFIDAEELQRVVRSLGLKGPSQLENCRRMIRNFDENGDGRIDFNEFVKFMENSLS